MKTHLQEANEFRTAYSIVDSPDKTSRSRQRKLIVEEFREFMDAEVFLFRNNDQLHADCLKELGDLVYVAYQYAANLGWDLDEALRRIHASNLSKLDETGHPIKRGDGKVLKGPNYKPPHLNDLI